MAASDFLDDCSCDQLRLSDNWTCLRDPVLNQQNRDAIKIVLLNAIVAGMCDQDTYTLAELLDLGKCCDCMLNDLDYDALMTLMLWLLAYNVGTISLVPGELLEEACRLNCDPKFVNAIQLVLWCKFFQCVKECYDAWSRE